MQNENITVSLCKENLNNVPYYIYAIASSLGQKGKKYNAILLQVEYPILSSMMLATLKLIWKIHTHKYRKTFLMFLNWNKVYITNVFSVILELLHMYFQNSFQCCLPASSRPKLDTLSAGEVKSLCFQYNSKMHNAFSSITAVIALEVLKAT